MPFAGCPGRCVYCNQNKITGVGSIPSPDFVRALLESQTEPREICFFGGSFLRFPFNTVKAYLDTVVQNAPQGSTIRFSTYPNDLDDEKICALLKEYPISRVELGIQSLDDNVLQLCKRDISSQKVLQSVARATAQGFPLGMQLMIGLPGQTEESSLDDLKKLAEIKQAQIWDLRIYPCLVIEGTELAQMYAAGKYSPLSVDRAAAISGKLLFEAERLGFNVIRIGLQESISLAESVIAGPHHPALGELARSHALVQKLVAQKQAASFELPQSARSKLSGHNDFGYRLFAKATGKSLEETKAIVQFV